jgi:DNA-binding beta-propeller fold protein YncE
MDGTRLFVSGGENGDIVSVYRTSDLSEDTTIQTGRQPFGMAVTPDGQEIYVVTTDDQMVWSYRTSDYERTSFYEIGDIEPMNVAVHPGGRFVYVTGWGTKTYIIDRQTDDIVDELEGIGAYAPGCNIAFLPDGSRAYISNGDGTVAVLGF